MDRDVSKRDFPILSGIFFGLGLGGFFDGIVLHQILQWHHMLTSAGYPANTLDNLEFNIVWDGIFHASTYLFVVTASPSSGVPRANSTSDGQESCCQHPCWWDSAFSIWLKASSTITSWDFTTSTRPCLGSNGSIGTSAFWSGAQ